MATLASIMAELKQLGTEQARKIYSRHGMRPDLLYGVSIASLKTIAKTIKKQQALACELYATGIMEAMYLAGLVADGSQMSTQQLDTWVKESVDLRMISEYTVPWITVENPNAIELSKRWMQSKQEHVAAAGWCTYTGLLTISADDELDFPEIRSLLSATVSTIHGTQDRVRHAMNNFVIAVGTYVEPLMKEAQGAAKQIGNVSVDVGETACKIPLAAESIAKAVSSGRIGKKKKTIRC